MYSIKVTTYSGETKYVTSSGVGKTTLLSSDYYHRTTFSDMQVVKKLRDDLLEDHQTATIIREG